MPSMTGAGPPTLGIQPPVVPVPSPLDSSMRFPVRSPVTSLVRSPVLVAPVLVALVPVMPVRSVSWVVSEPVCEALPVPPGSVSAVVAVVVGTLPELVVGCVVPAPPVVCAVVSACVSVS